MKKEEIYSLSKIVNYQNDAIVSKTIIDNKSGSLTLFAFDKGQSLSEHTSPFDAIVNIFEGEAKIIISGESYRLKKGNMIIMPKNKPHSVKAEEQFKMLLIMIRE